jgi:two-component system OmpR family response regulator
MSGSFGAFICPHVSASFPFVTNCIGRSAETCGDENGGYRRDMRGTTLLIVEDDHEICALLADFLGREGYVIETAKDGAGMERLLTRMTPDLVILDIMLPGEDGLSICRRLRARGSQLPILMLTAKDEDVDRIVGLEIGADDYLGKPFNPRELLARIRALLRRIRACEEAGGPLRRRKTFSGLTVDLDARRVEGEAGVRVPLTSAEFDLLACFVERPHRVLSREQLLDWTRGRSAEPFDRTIDVTVSRLRAKLNQAVAGADGLITTVRNVGYLFSAEIEDL